QTPLSHHYVPLTVWGRVVLAAHWALQRTRKAIKANKRLMTLLRAPGQVLHRARGTTDGV
ncbi:MAG TPA: hypothetical protein VL133_13860, partial [Devosia sp.]|nr:hypothetical protein [Devosia sp.]